MSSAPKFYAPEEERLNIWSHAFGAACTPFALWYLLHLSQSAKDVTASVIYMATMFASLFGSACYHAAKNPDLRAKLRLFDHSAIYLLISGSYTPLCLLGVPGTAGIVILCINWAIAILGVTLELLKIKPFKGFSILLYLISGWLCIWIFQTLLANISTHGLVLLVGGGVAYSAGVIFYVSRWKYAHAIWHVFVLAGIALHYFSFTTMYPHP